MKLCNSALLVISVFLFFQVHSQEKNNDSTVKPIKPRFSERDLPQIETPNIIELIGLPKEFRQHKSICGRSLADVLLVRTDKIINVGRSIVNPLKPNAIITTIFDKRLASDTYKLPDTISKNTGLYKIKVLEQLCPNTNMTVYFITSIVRL